MKARKEEKAEVGFARVDMAGALQAVGGLILLAFLPGFTWSRALLPHLRGLERIVISIGLSVALLTIVLYAGSVLAQIDVSASHAVWTALALSAAGAGATALLAGRERETPPAR